VVINKGSVHKVQPGSPVLDESGVLGQVTRVYAVVSEVTLLIDRDQVIPVLDTRSGVRGLAHGEPTVGNGVLDLRFMPTSADVQVGDLFTTSGMDGVYPMGLPVAKVLSVEKRTDSPFLRIRMAPLATASDVRHVMVIPPLTRPEELDALEAEERQSTGAAAAPGLGERVVGAVAGAIRAGAPAASGQAGAPASAPPANAAPRAVDTVPRAAPVAAPVPGPAASVSPRAARPAASAPGRQAPARTRTASEARR
jgi:rod shape-determining protein MreC